MQYIRKPFNFKDFGQALKKARESRGLTREQLAEMLDLSARYIMSVENNGQHTSLQKLYEITTLFNISIDEFFFHNQKVVHKSTRRRQLDAQIDLMDEADLIILSATAEGINKAKQLEEE